MRMPNSDDLAGVLVRPLQVLRTRPHNTIDRLRAYEGLTPEELFPEPNRIPRVRSRPRWSLPGFDNEDLFFGSLHEPVERRFAEHYHSRSRRFQTVYARRIRPRGTEGRPRLLYIHGGGNSIGTAGMRDYHGSATAKKCAARRIKSCALRCLI